MELYCETDRLCIREATEEDADDLLAILTDEAVLKYNCYAPPTPESIREDIQRGDYKYCVALKSSGHVIGVIGLSNDLRHKVNSLCLSYELNQDYTGKGYMTEAMTAFLRYAFYTLNCDIIAARILGPNIRSIRLIERLGFVHEGTLRHAVCGYHDIIYDDRLYSLTREEYGERFEKPIQNAALK